MATDILMPQKKNDTSIGRRLFAMAAPIAGMAIGGPAGALAGGVLGSKMAGGDVMGGLQAGIGGMQTAKGLGIGAEKAAMANPVQDSMLQESQKLQNPADQFGRRLALKSQDPQLAIEEGINVASAIPDLEQKKQFLEPLIRAKMASQKMVGR